MKTIKRNQKEIINKIFNNPSICKVYSLNNSFVGEDANPEYVMEKYYRIPRAEIVDRLGGILNFSGIVNPDKSEILTALLKYENSHVDIVDCILSAHSSPEKVVISFDKDLEKLKAVCVTL